MYCVFKTAVAKKVSKSNQIAFRVVQMYKKYKFFGGDIGCHRTYSINLTNNATFAQISKNMVGHSFTA